MHCSTTKQFVQPELGLRVKDKHEILDSYYMITFLHAYQSPNGVTLKVKAKAWFTFVIRIVRIGDFTYPVSYASCEFCNERVHTCVKIPEGTVG